MNPSNLRKNFADDLLEKKLSTYDKQLSIEGDLNLKKLAKPVAKIFVNIQILKNKSSFSKTQKIYRNTILQP